MSRRTQNVIIIVVVIACECMSVFCQFVSSLHFRHSMTANVLALGEGGDFHHKR
jgi:hypothetical protein